MAAVGRDDVGNGYTDIDLDDDNVHKDSTTDAIDVETASQRSVPLNSPPTVTTPLRAQEFFARRDSQDDSIEIDFNSETDEVSDSQSAHRKSSTSVAPFATLPPIQSDVPKSHSTSMTYPPTPSSRTTDTESFSSVNSSYSKKARPESMLLQPPEGPLVLGIALVDFNHLVSLHLYMNSSRSLDNA